MSDRTAPGSTAADTSSPDSTAPGGVEDAAPRGALDEVGEDARPAEVGRADAPRQRYRPAVLLLALLGLLLAAAAVTFGVRLHQDGSRDRSREDAVAAAEQQAVNVTSLSAKDVDEGLKRIADNGTGGFKSDYDAQAARLKQAVTSQQVASSGKVVDAAVESYDGSHAAVLLIVDGTTANRAQPTAQPRRYRMRVEVSRVDGRWLTSALSVLS